jgi:hypothetical protein
MKVRDQLGVRAQRNRDGDDNDEGRYGQQRLQVKVCTQSYCNRVQSFEHELP